MLPIVAQGKEGTETGHQSDAQTPEALGWQSSLILGTISQSLQVPSTAWQLQGDSRWQKARPGAVDFDEVWREVQGPRLRGPERELSARHSGETQELTEDDDCTPISFSLCWPSGLWCVRRQEGVLKFPTSFIYQMVSG